MAAPAPSPGNTQPLPRISESEWIVMRTLWAKGPLTTNQVVEALAGRTAWKPKTIHTLLSRLVQKGALRSAKRGREYEFQTTVTEEECERAVTRSFLDRFFNGELAPMLARFVETQPLSADDVARLKKILDGNGDPT